MAGMDFKQVASALDAETERLLLTRIHGGLWILLAAIAVYTIAERVLLPGTPWAVSHQRLLLMAVIVGALVMSRLYPSRRASVIVALATIAAVCTSAAASGNATGETATMSILSVVLSILSATLFPWGVTAHATLVGITALTTLWNLLSVPDALSVRYALSGSTVVAIWGGSFYVLRELQRNRRTVIRETLERKRAEETAHRHEAALAHVGRISMMGGMAAELAHELNQPLSAIVSYARGCVRRMQGGAAPSAEILQALDDISEQAVRASEIIRRLRAFVRKGEAKREVAVLNDVVANAARFAEAEARDYGVRMRFQLAPNLPNVEVDTIQIEQVVLNLVRNGCEAMRDTGKRENDVIITTARESAGTLLVAVRDRGMGISQDLADNLFEPFSTTKPDGLGMGLAICRTIVESHGGRLWGEANSDGGATFRFTVPIMAKGGRNGR